MNVHVLGANSGIGKWFVDNGLCWATKIYAYDISENFSKVVSEQEERNDKSKKQPENIQDYFFKSKNVIAKLLDINNIDYLKNLKRNLKNNDWVFIATPIGALEEVCRLLSKEVETSYNVAVMTSTQSEPLKNSKKFFNENANVYGIHTLFGHTIQSPFGRTIAICNPNDSDSEDEDENIKFLSKSFTKTGFIVVEISPEKHDESMGYIQALTHFSFLVFSDILTNSSIDITELVKLKTPPFQFLTAFSSRLLSGSPETYASIQNTDIAKNIREKFINSATSLNSQFSDKKETTEIIKKFTQDFPREVLKSHSQLSVIAVDAVQNEEKKLYEFIQNSEIVVFHRLNSSIKRVGIIKSVQPEFIYIDEFVTRVNEYYPLPLNPKSKNLYKKKGIQIKYKKIKIKKQNFKFSTRGSTDKWIKENVLLIEMVMSFQDPNRIPEEFLERWIPTNIASVKSFEYLNSFKEKGQVYRTLAKIRFFPIETENEVFNKIQEVFY